MTRPEATLVARSAESLVYLLASQAAGRPACPAPGSGDEVSTPEAGVCAIRILDGAVAFTQTVNVPVEVFPDQVPPGVEVQVINGIEYWSYADGPAYRPDELREMLRQRSGCEIREGAVAMRPEPQPGGNLKLFGTFDHEDQCALADWGPLGVPTWEVRFHDVEWSPGFWMPFSGSVEFPGGILERGDVESLRRVDGIPYEAAFSFEDETFLITVTSSSDPGTEAVFEALAAREVE